MSSPAFLPLDVARKQRLTADIHLFELRHSQGSPLPPFTPGAHLAVRLPNGMQRQYSLCSDPAALDSYQIAVKREASGRGGSACLVDRVVCGDTLQASLPQNAFELAPGANEFVFVAGGIGITPILSMIRQVSAMPGKRFRLVYCTRDPASTAFADELSRPGLADRVRIHHDYGRAENMFDFWSIFERPTRAHVYCCGPRGLMDSVRDASGHWPAGAIHFESFGAAPATSENRAFQVRLRRSGAVVAVGKEQSILDALREHGHRVASSCESGTCGSCRTGLVDGIAEHRDLVLAEEEKSSQIMVCVSRAQSDELVLDL